MMGQSLFNARSDPINVFRIAVVAIPGGFLEEFLNIVLVKNYHGDSSPLHTNLVIIILKPKSV